MQSTDLVTLRQPDHAFRRAIGIVSGHVGIPIDRVVRPSGRVERRARHHALYLASVVADHGCCALARVAGLSPWGVGKALRAVEDSRDDPEIDRKLATLEEAMTS